MGNRETRTILLDVEFHGFSQGDLSIADYCRRFKKMADQLDDLGSPVSDRTLVLNVLRGLNERFTSIGVHLRRARPFPTFKEVQAELLLEEMNMAHQSSSASPAAFVASSTPKQAAPSGGAGSGGTRLQHTFGTRLQAQEPALKARWRQRRQQWRQHPGSRRCCDLRRPVC